MAYIQDMETQTGDTEMTRHYSHKEWNALSTDAKLALFNNPKVEIVRAASEVRVTFWN